MTFQKFFNYSLKAFIILLITCLTVLCATYIFMQRNPQELASKYLNEAAKKSGLVISFKSVHVTLLPLPAIGLADLNVQGNDFELNIAWLSLRPSLLKLLGGDFVPEHIIVLRPKFYFQSDALLNDPFAFLGKMGLRSASEKQQIKKIDMPALLSASCSLDVIEAYSLFTGNENRKAILKSLDASLFLNEVGELSGTLDCGSFRLSKDLVQLFSLEAVKLNGYCDLNNFFGEKSQLALSGRTRIGSVLEYADFNANIEYSDYDWSGNLDIDAVLNLDGELLPAMYKGRIFSLADSMEIISRNSEFMVDADSGKMELSFHMPTSKRPWSLDGKVFFNRVSLTQWLGFARGLPPGLQLALDNITNASLQFSLNALSLKLENISATSTGATFTGNGSVSDFLNPVVELDLKSRQVNLGLAIPEALIKSPEAVYFPYEPLTPRSGIPLAAGESGVGYDIKLAADKLIYGPLVINNAKLRIYPGKMDVMRLEDVLLDGSGKFYGGTVKGHCILGADPSLPLYIKFQSANINMAALARALPVLPFTQGIFQGEGAVFSKGKRLPEFLANLDGPLKFTGSKVTLAALKNEQISNLEFKSQLSGADTTKNGINFGGKWNLDIYLSGLSAALEMNGKLGFDANGLIVKSVPSSMKFKFLEKTATIPKGRSLELKGQLSAQSNKGQYKLEQISLDVPGARIQGNALINAKVMDCSGKMNVKVQDTASLMRFFSGTEMDSLPPLFSKLSLESNYSANIKGIKLQKINLLAAELRVSGYMNVDLIQKPNIEFDLNATELDWEKSFASNKEKRKSSWDFSWLKSFNCRGKLKLGTFTGWGVNLSAIKIPLDLENGKLSIADMRADFYGSELKAQAEMDFEKALKFKTIISASEFKLEEAAKAQKLESVLMGRASIGATLSATLNGAGEMPGKLDGLWNFRVVSGSWQGRDKGGKLKGSPIRFDLARASGKMRNGRMESNDILLKNGDMQVSGEGWLNLVSNKIDCKLNVDMKNMPEFPLYVYGPVDNPTTSIGAGKLVLNAIGGISAGIGNLFGNLFKGLGNIFR